MNILPIDLGTPWFLSLAFRSFKDYSFCTLGLYLCILLFGSYCNGIVLILVSNCTLLTYKNTGLIYVHIVPARRQSVNPYSLSTWWLPSQEDSMEREEKSKFIVKKKILTAKWRSTSVVISLRSTCANGGRWQAGGQLIGWFNLKFNFICILCVPIKSAL